jgi:hypothetical protein
MNMNSACVTSACKRSASSNAYGLCRTPNRGQRRRPGACLAKFLILLAAWIALGPVSAPTGNTYPSGTILTAGTITVSNASGSATGTGPFALNGGVLSSGSLATIAGTVTAGASANQIAPGGVGAFGTLYLGGLVTSSSTTLDFDLNTSGGSGDLINVTGGSLTIANGTQINLNNPGLLLPGSYYPVLQFLPGTTTVTGSGNFTFTGALPRQLALCSLAADPTNSALLDVYVAPVTSSIASQ